MKRNKIGNLDVSEICLGSMTWGEQNSEAQAHAQLDLAVDKGVNFIDTADLYNKGQSEIILSQVLAGQRQQWVLASKIGNRASKQAGQGYYAHPWVLEQVDAILGRLKTDYLDILYLHRDHPSENLEVVVLALGELIKSGKIRHFGLSNFRGWRIAEVIRLCDAHGVPRPVVCQPYYNLLNRGPEVEILPACAHYGLGVVPYSPLARGVLTGKYLPGQPPAEGTRAATGDQRILETEFREESLVIAQKIKTRCEAKGWVPGHFAAAWVLANPIVTSVIVGPRLLSHLEDVYGATELKLDSKDEAFVNELVVPGHASSHGYNDPSYPFFGRPVA